MVQHGVSACVPHGWVLRLKALLNTEQRCVPRMLKVAWNRLYAMRPTSFHVCHTSTCQPHSLALISNHDLQKTSQSRLAKKHPNHTLQKTSQFSPSAGVLVTTYCYKCMTRVVDLLCGWKSPDMQLVWKRQLIHRDRSFFPHWAQPLELSTWHSRSKICIHTVIHNSPSSGRTTSLSRSRSAEALWSVSRKGAIKIQHRPSWAALRVWMYDLRSA